MTVWPAWAGFGDAAQVTVGAPPGVELIVMLKSRLVRLDTGAAAVTHAYIEPPIVDGLEGAGDRGQELLAAKKRKGGVSAVA